MDIRIGVAGAELGPFRIGMAFEEALATARSLEGYQPPRPGVRRQPGVAHYASGLSVLLGADRRGRLQVIEFYRPEVEVRLWYRDISLFELSADEVIARLVEQAEGWENEDGERVSFRTEDEVVALWRPFRSSSAEDDPQGWYFQSVLVAARDHCDGPPSPR
ncbi:MULTISPECIES: hypothetical protein [Actinosynnema]|uniref:hypothetical protein n=1 Tax=Actinosynnema TaxID=40566 RepID=UPI0020A477FF|nr:hypothetical protein [Actinosynnema pretiosum]MCP2094585.1 hypothetical protein [Actinosynnema pretiosum]